MKNIFFILLLLAIACKPSPKENEKAVARVFDEFLYVKDLDGVLPPNLSPNDSTDLIQEHIDNWIRKQLIIKQAENNLTDEEKDFSRQLKEYKNSLLVYKYETKLIEQYLDTVVSENEIADYYEKNKSNFELKENIVKVIYVKIPRNISPASVRPLLNSNNPSDKKKLQDFCAKYAVNYYIDDQSWLFFNDMLKEIPIKTYNQEEYLKNNRMIEIQDSVYTYLLNIKGFMIKESLSPLSFENKNIKAIIINKRKMMLIEEMQADVYNKAIKKGNFEVFK